MFELSTLVLVLYFGCLAPLVLWGLHRGYLLLMSSTGSAPQAVDLPELPRVTVQLPLFNERFVAERAVRAMAALDYPADRLQIQVLDDSTDDTTDLLRPVVAQLADTGLDIQLLHRTDRTGFKAGALDAALPVATGELVAIFDADFLPHADFLRRVVPFMAPDVGMVQARWGHLNAAHSWLTGAQATLLDGHFVIEHAARARHDRWFNFNGTAGIWRRQAIDDAGGWQHDTLTEDMDLSYRSQLAGWRFVFVPQVVAPAELPQTMAAFKTQQFRWAKGSLQVARKLFLRLMRAPIPLGHKVEIAFHLLGNVAHPLMVVVSFLLPLAVWSRGHGSTGALLLVDLVVFIGSMGSITLYYGAAITRSGAPGIARRLLALPLVFALGAGIALSQSRAVFSGLFGDVGVFVRTPKQGSAGATYRSAVHWSVVGEVLMGLWLCAGFVVAASQGYYASLPFLGLFAAGWTLVGFSSLGAALRPARRVHAQPTPPAATAPEAR